MSIGKDIHLASELLQKGELVAIPTETVYGLAGNALNLQAVADIFRVKNRPTFDPLIIHLDNFDKVEKFVEIIPDWAEKLAEKFSPGAITFLLKRKRNIPDLVTNGSDLVAVRIPAHPTALQLMSLLDFPLAAPSANPFGYVSPTTAQHVEKQLGKQIPYILDGGQCSIGLESTIIGEDENQELTIYRVGGISVESIEKIVGKVSIKAHSSSNPLAPGMLQSHYAPQIPLYIGQIDNLLAEYSKSKIGIISFQRNYLQDKAGKQIILSPSGNISEAAQNLFAALRTLDEYPLDVILTEFVPETGLGRAINDRLKRAAAKR